MKQIILMSAMALTTMAVQAQDLKPVLEKTFLAFDTTQQQDVRIEQSNKLALIAKKWDKEWVTHYYVSYSKVNISYFEKDNTKKDALLDEADKELEDAVSILGKQNDETHVLAAMIANARLGVDPMNRWQKYGQVFSSNLQEAQELNPDNPRMYYLQGVTKFFTPKQFGGGAKIAQPYFEKAEPLFAKEPGGDIMKPYWGKRQNAYFLTQCKAPSKEEEKK